VIAALTYRSYFSASNKAIDSIAIMPLVNAGNDPETEYLSDGITESLINTLSQFPQLRVPARTTAFHYKGKEIDPQQVGRELGVRAVLTGRLIQRGDTLDLQVEVVETSNGSQIWGGQYNRKMSDLRVFRQELVRDITEKLRLRLSGEDEKLRKGNAGNTEAYQSYLKGRYFWNKRNKPDIEKAMAEFQQAIDKDPNYALAYVGLADCYILRYGTPETVLKARAAVQRALQIDDSLAEAHASLGAVEMYSWNFDEAEREFKRAIELKPNYALAHYFYAYYLRLMRGRFDEAMAELSQAQQLDPLAPSIGVNIAAIHESKGEFDAGIQELKKVLELEPNFSLAHLVLGNIYCKQRRYTEAIAEHEMSVQFSGRGNTNLRYLGMCYAAAGHRSRVEAILKELEEKYARREIGGIDLAGIYGELGDKDQAFAWLEKDFQAHRAGLPLIAYDRVMRDALSSDPRFNDLLRRIGLLQN
jgi:TolB-like protein/Tfp pilus assembly protein PilF